MRPLTSESEMSQPQYMYISTVYYWGGGGGGGAVLMRFLFF